MNHNHFPQNPTYHYASHQAYYQAMAAGYHVPYGQPPTPSYPPPMPLGGGNVPLPTIRLSPLFNENEQELPPVPFVVGSRSLDRRLQWGRWRPLPSTQSPYPSHQSDAIPSDTLLGPATSPGKGELMLVVMMPGEAERDVPIRPRTIGSPAVSVQDVIRVVESEMRRAERKRPAGGNHRYIGQSVSRGMDGIWMWCGLVAAKDENDVWMLYL